MSVETDYDITGRWACLFP